MYLTALRRVVESGRIGEPVHLRILISCDPAAALSALASAAAEAELLLGGRLQPLEVMGSPGSGLTVLARIDPDRTVVLVQGTDVGSREYLLVGTLGVAASDDVTLPRAQQRAAGVAPSEMDGRAAELVAELSARLEKSVG